ncbi:MAG: glycosyltransferase family 2 protein, partial [Ilumatobacteraceae bacterium]
MASDARSAHFEKLTLFFPMWNEEEYIDRTLQAAREAAEALIASGEVADYEIVVVDDASTDATGRLADEIAAVDPRVRVVHHPKNRKLGGSIKTGFAAATGDLVLYTDADLPFDMDELQKACRLMRHYEADVVSAYRLDRTGEGYVRTVYSFFYNALVRVFFGLKMRDVNFAFKLCRRRIFDHVELKSEGSFIDAELVVRAHKFG